jgi:folate-binding Fe-S cluster repair protein YgfZ
VRGRDATSLLQNVATTDMNVFSKEGADRAALYSSFLNVKGKTLFDAFIVKPRLANQCADDTEYWLDLHETDIEQLRKHLHKYALRRNVQIEDISHIIKSFSIQTMLGVQEKEGYFFQ